jgi:hypothetical protein
VQLADVKTVIEDVRENGPGKSRLVLRVEMAFRVQAVRKRFKGEAVSSPIVMSSNFLLSRMISSTRSSVGR